MPPMPLRRSGWTLAALLAAPRPALADKADSVLKLVDQGKHSDAAERCDRWAAHAEGEDPRLREACASAAWPGAEADDSERAWANYRARWAGTSWAPRAFDREAAAALRDLPKAETEANLLILADRYGQTPSGPPLKLAAARAAIRDAADADGALAVARRYPDAAELPSLVERFPAAFIQVQVSGREVDWRVEGKIALTGPLEPKVRWIAREADGTGELWDRALQQQLPGWGVPEPVAAALPVGDKAPALPVCHLPAMAPGWGPAVEVQVGKGVFQVPAPYDEGCGPEAWPTFLALTGGRVTGASLRPGHAVDLLSPKDASGRRTVRAWAGELSGTPQLSGGTITQQAGSAYVVTPISGGTPWATGKAPDASALPLTSRLKGAGLPSGWTVSREGGRVRVDGPPLARMPEALRSWSVPGDEVRFVPPALAAIFGLTAKDVTPRSPAAPQLNAAAGWVLNPDRSLQRTPPAGATVAGITRLDDAGVEGALGVVAGIGIARGRFKVYDGWKVDLDDDRVLESVLRVSLDEVPALVVVDPLVGAEAYTADAARVFVLEEPGVVANAGVSGLPFTFRKGSFIYMAWGGIEVLGATSRKSTLTVLRFDGTGFVSDRFDLGG